MRTLQAMLAFVRDGDTVVVHSMDRLARNLDDLRRLMRELTVDTGTNAPHLVALVRAGRPSQRETGRTTGRDRRAGSRLNGLDHRS